MAAVSIHSDFTPINRTKLKLEKCYSYSDLEKKYIISTY